MSKVKVSVILWALLGLAAATLLTACTLQQQVDFQEGHPDLGGHGSSSSSSSSSSGGVVSDRRLKTDIKRIATSPSGLPIYSFRYVSGGPTYVGVIAQDVLKVRPAAVRVGPSGYMTVDYDMIDVKLMTLDAYNATHDAQSSPTERSETGERDHAKHGGGGLGG